MKELHPFNSPKARETANLLEPAFEHWLNPLLISPIPLPPARQARSCCWQRRTGHPRMVFRMTQQQKERRWPSGKYD
jgi:hypothetical protein